MKVVELLPFIVCSFSSSLRLSRAVLLLGFSTQFKLVKYSKMTERACGHLRSMHMEIIRSVYISMCVCLVREIISLVGFLSVSGTDQTAKNRFQNSVRQCEMDI